MMHNLWNTRKITRKYCENTRKREDSIEVCRETSQWAGKERKMGESPWKTCKGMIFSFLETYHQGNHQTDSLKSQFGKNSQWDFDLRSWALKFWLWAGCEACQTFSTCTIDNSTLTRGSIFKTFLPQSRKNKKWLPLMLPSQVHFEVPIGDW